MMKNIIEILQDKVDELSEKLCKDMNEKPIFKVYSIYYNDDEFDAKYQTIVITLEWRSHRIGRVVYPHKDEYYGHQPLGDIMEEMLHQLTQGGYIWDANIVGWIKLISMEILV